MSVGNYTLPTLIQEETDNVMDNAREGITKVVKVLLCSTLPPTKATGPGSFTGELFSNLQRTDNC